MSKFFDRARFMRDHRWAPGQMSDYLDGELAANQQQRIERHLLECRECRRLLRGLRQTLSALARLPPLSGEEDALRIAASVRTQLGELPPS
jgi:anti-sigma factor RsiW